MPKAIVAPTNKHEQDLVALGRKEEQALRKQAAAKAETEKLEAEKKAAKREGKALAEETRTTTMLAMGGGVVAGAGGGAALQHYVLDKSADEKIAKGEEPNRWIQRGTLPGVGILAAVGGLFLPGAIGSGVIGLGLGLAAGSGGVSIVKKAMETP